MVTIESWVEAFEKETIKNFVESEMHTKITFIAPMFDEKYGKCFLCQTTHNMKEYNGEDGFVIELGSFGLITRGVGGFFEDDFSIAKFKPNILKEYVLFVAKNNITDGEERRIDGETYQEVFNSAFLTYAEKFNSSKQSNYIDYRALMSIYEDINKGFEDLKHETELGRE